MPAPQLTESQLQAVGWVSLSWSEVSGAREYVLERSEDPRGTRFREVYREPDRSYSEIPPRSRSWPGLRYRVRAEAYGQAGRWSDTLSVLYRL
jgi:hypothetical protein